jgi:anti-sigma factor ChrR (cupin superfamily)
MKAVAPNHRQIVNIHNADYLPFDGLDGQSYLQLDTGYPPGAGFHIFRMEPGTTTTPHEHTCDEQWLMLEGEMTDNDGTYYRPGDMVLMKKGTQHSSSTVDGCLLAVFIATPETNLHSATA